jgi:hypothetical protein
VPHSAKSLAAVLASALLGLLACSATALALHIHGTPRGDSIRGSAGNDRIVAGRGDDTVVALAGRDRVFGNRGDDRLEGRAGADRLHGNSGNDTLIGDAARIGDRISRDRLFGGRGNDTLVGGDGFDRIHGGPGDDNAKGNGGRDFMSGGIGNDGQEGGPGPDRIFANLGQDTTSGGPGDDVLWALARDVSGPGDVAGDTVRGDDGNDRIRVRDGEQDVVNCGPGVDRAFLDMADRIEDATPQNANGSCEVVQRAVTRAYRGSGSKNRRPGVVGAHVHRTGNSASHHHPLDHPALGRAAG